MVEIHYPLAVFFICYLMAMVTVGDKLPPPLVSQSCKKIGICETVANYPTLLARKLIQELKNNNTIFTSDNEDDISELNNYQLRRAYNTKIYQSGTFSKWLDTPRTEFRISDLDEDYFDESDDEIKLCESIVQYKRPLLAENRNNTWEYILNDKVHPVQQYRTVICKTSNSRCSQKLRPAPNYEATCIQKWTFKEMYYIDKEQQVAKAYFKVPTCCSCKLFHLN
ncbi:neurotrophin 1-like [Nymphalis io]|uniref:neurotrophin 1-like n=1 Tax=Inachis io TaxID=171585 RepID=UPI00216A0AE1|nr:neurotrophin 1-like [Nymphalis io]